MNLTYEQTEELLSKLSLASARNCSQWVNTIIDEDDLCVILRDKRSSYKHISFYQEFPELEVEAKFSIKINIFLNKALYVLVQQKLLCLHLNITSKSVFFF